jgi:hypothetical protein
LIADGSGLIPFALNAERGVVGWLIVGPHRNPFPLSSSSTRITQNFTELCTWQSTASA